LRCDFAHFEPLTAEQISAVEDLVNTEVLANHPARHYETTKDQAEQSGAIAFFGDKYGEVVRVLEAGPNSVELCGGTHVSALGDIGAFRIVSEGSIGANIRRLEALTGMGSIERMRTGERAIADAAGLLGVSPDDLVDAVERRLVEIKELKAEVRDFKRRAAMSAAGDLADVAENGVVVARMDGQVADELRQIALAVRERPGITAVVLIGSPDGASVSLVAAADTAAGRNAGELIAEAARIVKGGGGKNAELAVAGGKDAGAIDEALAAARVAAGLA
jgi:alanyl-tRNA synthetase